MRDVRSLVVQMDPSGHPDATLADNCKLIGSRMGSNRTRFGPQVVRYPDGRYWINEAAVSAV